MKIIGFAQLRNESHKGNLENWFKCMEFCDYIYIYDQASDDGSKEFYKNYNNVVVIESPTNDFHREIACKRILLEKLLKEHPDVDWIFWLDGDTLLDGRMLRNNGKEFKLILKKALTQKVDIVTLGHLNLWRSDIHYRVDNDYDWLHNHGVKVFWRNNGKLSFPDNAGLHQPQHPMGLKREIRIDRNLIHRGFATDDQIISRYELYKSKGQKGHDLERLLDEKTLTTKEVSRIQLPDWFMIKDDNDPTNKNKLRPNSIVKNLEIVAMIYKSLSYLKMIHKEMTSSKNFVAGWDINYRIVANNATDEIINYLKGNKINHTIYSDPCPEDFYLNRVYRCWNYCVSSSKCDNVCLVNSDMVFSDNWLENLLEFHDGTTIPCSRLVESGKMPSGKYGITEFFGNHPTNIQSEPWNDWALNNREKKMLPGGLYMPCVFKKSMFVEAGGYPEGNVFKNGDRMEIGHPNDRPVTMSGDEYLFKLLEEKFGVRHVTIFNSLVYHIQEGEKDE